MFGWRLTVLLLRRRLDPRVGRLDHAESGDAGELAEFERQEGEEALPEVYQGSQLSASEFMSHLALPFANSLNQPSSPSPELFSPRTMTQVCSPVSSLVVCRRYSGTYPARFQKLCLSVKDSAQS
jgi:hypothetical protein